MTKRDIIITAAVVVLFVAGYLIYTNVFQKTKGRSFPERSISLNVYSAAGGGTDLWNRMVGSLMEQQWGNIAKINVSNVAGGGGAEAINLMFSADHDGYTWTGLSEGVATHVVNGFHQHSVSQMEFFLIAGSPGVLCVAGDSPYKTYEDLINAAKADPGKLKVGSSGLGKLWHIKGYIATGLGEAKFEFVSYGSSRPAIMAVLSHEVEVVSASAGEVVEFVRSGQLRPLAMEENEDFDYPGYGVVPSATKYFPEMAKYFPLDQFLGFALPSDTDPDILSAIKDVFTKSMASPDVGKFAREQLSLIINLSGKEAKAKVQKSESVMSWLLVDLGMNKKNPGDFNIARP
jgi:tripartite-type tricarboxylate transporter receptor subunit TctC